MKGGDHMSCCPFTGAPCATAARGWDPDACMDIGCPEMTFGGDQDNQDDQDDQDDTPADPEVPL